MTDTLGEDRLLDLGDIERALQAATPGPWERFEDGGEIRYRDALVANVAQEYDFPCLDPDDLPQTRAECEANTELIANAPAWLARLCARVRHLEARLDETAKYAASRREEAETGRARYAHYVLKAEAAEAASQRLTEALRQIIANESCEVQRADAGRGQTCLTLKLVAPCPYCIADQALGAAQ